jgi:adenine-specific DNA-methyltransferase
MAKRQSKTQSPKNKVTAETYRHPESTNVLRPEIGTQNRFRKKLPPQTYKYDSSLSPSLDWDGQNPAREHGEALIQKILEAETIEDAKASAGKLKAMSKAFLNWSGKAERLSFNVPSLPLFIHERLSTKAIIETLQSHRKKPGQTQCDMFEYFGDPQHSIADQILRAYEFQDKWLNRMILGDSLVVMNSLLRYEGLGGQVQMIYMDPPYGVKFGSNFQPFIRKRDVKHNDDNDMTREPEMVKAYRDTWELGLHSYLTYMRDRLLLAKDLLHPSGSVFVQISDENVHHVRELMDEVFGAENFCGLITFAKTSSFTSEILSSAYDYLIWYAKDKKHVKFRPLWQQKRERTEGGTYTWIELDGGTFRRLTSAEIRGESEIPGGKRFRADTIVSPGATQSGTKTVLYDGVQYLPSPGSHWKTTWEGMNRLVQKKRVISLGKILAYKRYEEDFPLMPFSNVWNDTIIGTFSEKLYVVQSSQLTIERCMLMTTDPGDLVLDPTCGSGTSAFVAEQWGRRWITIDTSRVPLALARQRLLTATFPWYELKEEKRGPIGGFVYKRKQNRKGDEVGGIVPHITLKSIANNEPPKEEVLADRPETDNKIVRVCGPFVFESTIPAPADWEDECIEDINADMTGGHAAYIARMIEVLRHSPVLHIDGGKTVSLKQVRPPAKTLSLSAEAILENESPVAILFGPENGAISEVLVSAAHDEASMKSRGYTHLYVIGFAIQPNARQYIERAAQIGIPATYIQATPDLMMGDLLKNMRSSQIFSVCGLPEVEIISLKDDQYQVNLLGLDVFDPATMETDHRSGDDVPAWFLDTDYNGLCFHVCQAFFPRTGAWEHLKKALKTTYEESVWDHLAGASSAPFPLGEHRQISVKVIDDRGNELIVVKKPDSGVQK